MPSYKRHDKGPRGVLLSVAAVSLLAVGAALLSQYRFNMPPCPWCVLQRLIYLVIAALALAAAWLAGTPRRALAGLGALLAGSGMAAALWQQLVAAKSPSCDMTLADRILDGLGLFDALPSVFMPMASCADAAVDLAGIPYAYWSLALFALLGLGCLVVAIGRRR
jgi:protein dithiol:quinone oxidoreductase